MTWLRQERFSDGQPPAKSIGEAARPKVSAGLSDDEWREILRAYKAKGAAMRDWPSGRGLPPQLRATRVPMTLRREFGFDE